LIASLQKKYWLRAKPLDPCITSPASEMRNVLNGKTKLGLEALIEKGLIAPDEAGTALTTSCSRHSNLLVIPERAAP